MSPYTYDHYKELDGLRGLAAQVVLLSHACQLVLSNPSPLFGWLARLAVIFFFVLSGFAITTTIKRRAIADQRFDALDYAIRRVARIYPPYVIAVVTSAIISGLSSHGLNVLGIDAPLLDFNSGAASWLRALLFLYTGRDAFPVVDIAIWSLRIEVALYIMAGLAAAAWFMKGVRRRILLVSSLAILTLVFCVRLSFMLPAILLFGFGSLASLLLQALPRVSWLWGLAVMVLVLCLPLALPSLMDDSILSLTYQAALGAPIAFCMILLAQAGLADLSWFTRFLVASGSWSYTLYIMHSPILIGLRTLLGDTEPAVGSPGRAVLIFTAYFATTNIICWGLALVFERPSFFAGLLRERLQAAKVLAR